MSPNKTLFFLLFALAQVQANAQYLQKEDALATLDSLIANLREYHPFAYMDGGDSLLTIKGKELKRTLHDQLGSDSIHYSHFIAHAAQVNTLLGDGHFRLTLEREDSATKRERTYRYPFYTTLLEDRRLVLRDTFRQADSVLLLPGTELLAIDNLPIAQLLPELGAGFGLDDHFLSTGREHFPAHFPLLFYQRKYGYKDSMLLRVKTPSLTTELLVHPQVRDSKPKISKAEAKKTMLVLQPTALNDVYLIEVPRFRTSVYQGANPYQQFKNSFDRLQQLHAKALILDLRGNTGGSLKMTATLFHHLTQEPFYLIDSMVAFHPRAAGQGIWAKIGYFLFGGVRKKEDRYLKSGPARGKRPFRRKIAPNVFDGELVVLVDGATFSGGTTLAHYVQHYNRGVVVGQAPGGSAERMYAGETFSIPIGPNDQFLINMPLWYIDMVGDARGAVVPDIHVPIELIDVIDQKDATMEAALAHLRNRLSKQ